MSTTPHVEKHFVAIGTIHDIIIGMSDGLTVPFALAAGLAGAVDATTVVITAGMAEIAAGSISMGLGGYLAARSDADYYGAELAREQAEIKNEPQAEIAEVEAIFRNYGLSESESALVTQKLAQRPDAWADFMMRFELGLEKPDPSRALKSGLTIGGAYIAGGLVPLSPYFFFAQASQALPYSIVLTLSALLIFGYAKGRFTGVPPLRSAIQTALIGGIAAAVAFAIARAIG